MGRSVSKKNWCVIILLLSSLSFLLIRILLDKYVYPITGDQSVVKTHRSGHKSQRIESIPPPSSTASPHLHSSMFEEKGLLSTLMLCREQPSALNSRWTTDKCLDDNDQARNERAQGITTLKAGEPLWVFCASQINQSELEMEQEYDWLNILSCPSFPEPKDPSVLLVHPIRHYDKNIYHTLVLKSQNGVGMNLWCVLDAAVRFRETALSRINSDDASNTTTTTQWRIEYRTYRDQLKYIESLYRLLEHDTITNNHMGAGKLPNTTQQHDTFSHVRYPLGNVSVFKQSVAFARLFRPNTQPSRFIMDIASRVKRAILKNSTSAHLQQPYYCLVILRSTRKRRFAGSKTGTATELIQALLNRSLPVRVVDLAYASVEDQINWFSSAKVVIGMHGAGLTNLVWMEPGTTVIEIAASYGWGQYLSINGTCQHISGVGSYMKADFFNLARRFDIRHKLVHPVYSTPAGCMYRGKVTLQCTGEHENPMGKYVFYVDTESIVDDVERKYNDQEKSLAEQYNNDSSASGSITSQIKTISRTKDNKQRIRADTVNNSHTQLNKLELKMKNNILDTI